MTYVISYITIVILIYIFPNQKHSLNMHRKIENLLESKPKPNQRLPNVI